MFDWFKRKFATLPGIGTDTDATPQVVFTATITVSGGEGPTVQIAESEIAERVKPHAFVVDTDPPSLKTADQWWEEETHKRRSRDGSYKAMAWLLPFVPIEIAQLESVQRAGQWGPHSATSLAKELRAQIREKRKAKQPHEDLLRALYGACVMSDVSASLAFEGAQPHYMARFVSLDDLEGVRCDYYVLGHQCIEALGKTDVKWLVEAFGEPAEHQSFDAAYPHIRRNAVARYCWSELRSTNITSKSLGWPQKSMQDWLHERVKRNIGYHKQWQAQVAERAERLKEQSAGVDEAWAATRQPFVVADLETTGLSAATDEILEFAAVLVEPDGTVTAEFAVLVLGTRPVPAVITRLTGITQSEVDNKGVRPTDAFAQFLAFVGTRPVFFHNAPFDAGFLSQASKQSKMKFSNPVHDTLPMARRAWPSLGSYKLSVLAEHVGAPAPTHRGLADVKATLAVILAARLPQQ